MSVCAHEKHRRLVIVLFLFTDSTVAPTTTPGKFVRLLLVAFKQWNVEWNMEYGIVISLFS